MRHLKVHWTHILYKYSSRMSYRADFVLSFFTALLYQFASLVFVTTIYAAGLQFPGWSYSQMILLVGVMSIVRGFSFMMFCGTLNHINRLVQRGSLDTLLTKPLSPLWLLIMGGFDEEDLGQLIGGIVITCASLVFLGGAHGSLLVFALLLALGALFYLSISILMTAATVYFINTWRLQELLDILQTFSSYPKTIYGQTAGAVVTFIIPIMIVAYYPASALLGAELAGIVPAIIAVLVIFGLSLFFWRSALRRYVSAGG